MLVSFSNSEILASFYSNCNTHPCVAGGVLAYQNTIIPKPSAKESFYTAFLLGSRPVSHLNLEVTAGQWTSAVGDLPISAHSHVTGELVNAPSQRKAAEAPAADSYLLNMGVALEITSDLFPFGPLANSLVGAALFYLLPHS